WQSGLAKGFWTSWKPPSCLSRQRFPGLATLGGTARRSEPVSRRPCLASPRCRRTLPARRKHIRVWVPSCKVQRKLQQGNHSIQHRDTRENQTVKSQRGGKITVCVRSQGWK